MIIMTSNAGASNIVSNKRLGFITTEDPKADYNLMKDHVMSEVRQTFKPEFLNRIDDIIVFHSLTKDDITKIVGIMLNAVNKRIYEQMHIQLKISKTVMSHLAEAGFDEKYGARPLRRAIQTQVEDGLAEEILSGHIKEGDTVQLKLKNDKIDFSVKR